MPGFHDAHVHLSLTASKRRWCDLGYPSSLDVMDRFYDHVTQTYQVSKKASLFGFSRGGLYAMNWASRHPERVAIIYLDAAVCDFKSWPAGKDKGTGSAGDWQKLLADYGFMSEQECERLGQFSRQGGLEQHALGHDHHQISLLADVVARAVSEGCTLTVHGDMYPELPL